VCYEKVQGVFFRKYTEAKAKELKLVGWVANTAQGTVKGQAQGDPVGISRIKYVNDMVAHPGCSHEIRVEERERDR
jgi:acylphosphatase